MFCDVVDSTTLSAQLDPEEEYRDVLRAYQAACVEATQRFDGYIAQHLGDGLLVYFGFRWCPSIACMTGLRIDSCRLLIKAVAKVWGHAIAQQLLHGPYVVRQTCRHSRRNRLPLLG
jgi:class 3 adenylate cyclase